MIRASRLGWTLLVPMLLIAGCDRVADLSEIASGGTTTKAKTLPVVAADFAARVEAGAPLMIANVLERDALTTFVLVSERDGDRVWRTQDNVTMSTRGGLMTGTRALAGDLMSADVAESQALVLAGRPGLAVRVHRYLDGQNGIEIDSYVCEISPRGSQDLAFDGVQFRATVIAETCTNPGNDFENFYWVSGGTVVQSVQWVGPEVGAISMRGVIR
ncbi:YjbF family lipoprotein [Frigidibacter sp.]|uniref:YjbF family lipoprotein n=1 Tax=Frigidibacter sp. TaxID=2586418 RepID=UPI002733F0E4|nr:YjbF family lipoprotein [Frigidibacter sp.]MDP3340200.1 YjbF family lipoprotein [Frigidibacter sp.]